ncbi:MAG: VOC family protein [Acetobacteraceae bacterium]
MLLQKLHHVAYRCADAGKTVAFYTNVLGLRFAHALTAEEVPSLKQHNPHIHVFFEMEDGSNIAFFEVPLAPPAKPDPNTPVWVQHLALEVKDEAALAEGKRRLDDAGVSVIGPIDHGFCKSIYFFDPSGHRLEMTARTEAPGAGEEFEAHAMDVLKGWQARGLKYEAPKAAE